MYNEIKYRFHIFKSDIFLVFFLRMIITKKVINHKKKRSFSNFLSKKRKSEFLKNSFL